MANAWLTWLTMGFVFGCLAYAGERWVRSMIEWRTQEILNAEVQRSNAARREAELADAVAKLQQITGQLGLSQTDVQAIAEAVMNTPIQSGVTSGTFGGNLTVSNCTIHTAPAISTQVDGILEDMPGHPIGVQFPSGNIVGPSGNIWTPFSDKTLSAVVKPTEPDAARIEPAADEPDRSKRRRIVRSQDDGQPARQDDSQCPI